MEEKIFEIDMIYIKNSDTNEYSLEFVSRRGKSVVLNFSKVESVEIIAPVPLEVRNAIMTCNAGGENILNMRFNTPTNLKISFPGKIIIEVI